jgi:hypothetical protein
VQTSSQGADVTAQESPHGGVSTKVTPVSAPEAASWSVVILAAYAITATLAYVVFTQLFTQTPEGAAFDAALERVRQDFRITVRLGDRIKGAPFWLSTSSTLLSTSSLCDVRFHTCCVPQHCVSGTNCIDTQSACNQNKWQSVAGFGGTGGSGRNHRHRISHRIYNDSNGQQHVQVQFNISGQGQRGIVSADMYKDHGEWKAAYLFVDIAGERIVLETVKPP